MFCDSFESTVKAKVEQDKVKVKEHSAEGSYRRAERPQLSLSSTSMKQEAGVFLRHGV